MFTIKYKGKKEKGSVRIPINGKQYSHGDQIIFKKDDEKKIKKQLPKSWEITKLGENK